ncbi:Uncharacterised protein [Bordetella pertussis]|nr:Uncharacterised protein [Bordetella pertussis]CPN67698.1 Uncharacterised protein [Bordetella pertussis]
MLSVSLIGALMRALTRLVLPSRLSSGWFV